MYHMSNVPERHFNVSLEKADAEIFPNPIVSLFPVEVVKNEHVLTAPDSPG